MLNIVKKFEELVNGKEDIMNILLDKEFIDAYTCASIAKTNSGFVVSYGESTITIAANGSIASIEGDATDDAAAMAITIIFLTTEFSQEDDDTVIDFLNEINDRIEWCGFTPFEVMCNWEDINPPGNAHTLLEMHRTGDLGFGAIKVPDNWNDISHNKKVTTNPEKLERRTRIW